MVLSLVPIIVPAQEKDYDGHEFSVYGKGGLSTLNFKVDQGTLKNGFGGGTGFQYVWFFLPNWGLQTGVETEFFNSKSFLPDGTRFRTVLWEDDLFKEEFVSEVKNYRNIQKGTYLNVPIIIQYQTPRQWNIPSRTGTSMRLWGRTLY